MASSKTLITLCMVFTIGFTACKKDKKDNADNSVSKCKACDGKNTFTDPRDGRTYNIAQIGDQCWFIENLNYDKGFSWCYLKVEYFCTTYGRLYDWRAALSACPEGWHLPSRTEWKQLTDYLGGEGVAGGKMKSTSDLWKLPNTGATNSSCFSGLPGGFNNENRDFYGIGETSFYWSSTEAGPSNAWLNVLNYDSGNMDPSYNFSKNYGIYCRCISD